MRYILIFLLLLQISFISPATVKGQRLQRAQASQQDTITPSSLDTTVVLAPKGDIETTIKYSSTDSMVFEVDRKVVHLYGNASIEYGSMSLKAAYIQIDYETNTLTAATQKDSAGTETGIPVFADGGESYEAKRIVYNYKTRRGRISEVVTQQGEGFIHAEVVKRNENNEYFGLNAKYTTCNLAHPHFYISTSKLKAIPNDKVMAGPFNLVIGDIPTPLGFLFGLFPTPKANRSSGILVPSFGENAQQGFFLRDGGYYFAWNDYIGTRLTGDIYSLGGYNIAVDNTYNKRYAYQGNLNLQYRYFKNDEADVEASRGRSAGGNTVELPPSQRTVWIGWNHNPVSKPGQGRFSASVNAGSSIHQRINYNSQQQYLSPSFQSNITYQKSVPNSPFSYTVKLSQQQSNARTLDGGAGTMTFTLPDINLSMTPVGIYEVLTGNTPVGQWYENFTIGYSTDISNRLSNVIAARRLNGIPVAGETRRDTTLSINPDNFERIWENRRSSATHNFNFGLGSFKLLRYFNLTPSFSYREAWLDRKFSYRFNEEQQILEVDTARFGRVYEYSGGASLSTNIYGTVYVKGKRVEAIRHLVRPTISYSYRPDFGRKYFDFYQRVQTGVDSISGFPVYDSPRIGLLPRFESNVPGQGLSSSLNFGLQNSIEMKVRSKVDTTGNKFEKVSIIDNLSLNGSYNFAADSLKMSPIRLAMNTRLFKLIDLNLTSTFDPYRTDSTGRRLNRYVFDGSNLNLARLTDVGLNIRANLSPTSFGTGAANKSPDNGRSDLEQRLNPFEPVYVDFKIPWTLSMDYTFYYVKSARAGQPNVLNQNVGLNGSVNLTEKWKVGYSANYDVTNQNISNARLDIHRDLHCWDMSISWIPFGFARGYNITINARSALLRDLRLTKRSSTSGLNFR